MKLHLTRTCVALCLALGTVSHAGPGAHHTPLTFDERVEYQLRLERLATVHWERQALDALLRSGPERR